MGEAEKKTAGPAGRLRVAEKEIATRLKGIVEQGHTPFLCLCLQIDQEVAAYYQVQAGKGRVGKEVLFGEYHGLPDLLVDGSGKTVLGRSEVAPEIVRGKVGRDACRIRALPGPL